MKVWEAPSFIFYYAFDNVCAVFYDRYPNSFAKHILSEDVISREITNDKIITRKLIVKKGFKFFKFFCLLFLGASFLKTVPKWLAKYVAMQFMPTLEESIYNRNSKSLITYTRNISWKKVLYMNEHCFYKPIVK